MVTKCPHVQSRCRQKSIGLFVSCVGYSQVAKRVPSVRFLAVSRQTGGGRRGDRRARLDQRHRSRAGSLARVGAPRGAGHGEGATAAVRVLGDDRQVHGRLHGQEGPEKARATSLGRYVSRCLHVSATGRYVYLYDCN